MTQKSMLEVIRNETLSRSRDEHQPEEVVELTFLLPAAQASTLEFVAKSQGMTTARLLRKLISDLIVNKELKEIRPHSALK